MSGARITFYGGARELGGNQFLVEDQGTKVLFDFGSNFDRMGKYYSFPASPKKFNALAELTMLGVYPNFDDYPGFDGIYRPDYLKRIGRTPTKKTLDGVVFTHAHLDHLAGIHFIRPDMDVWMDTHTKRIAYSMQETSSAPFNEFIDFYYSFEQAPRIREPGYTWIQGEASAVSRKINMIRPPEPFKVGNLTIEPVYVDHSMPGTCAMMIHTSAGVVVYTADLRLRGRRREVTENFIKEAAKRKPAYLLCEGSLIWKKHPGVEEDVVTHISNFIAGRKGLVVISYAPRDLDRILSVYKAARKNNRRLVVDVRQAFLFNEFDGEFGYPKTTHKHIGIYMPRKNKGTIDTNHSGQERDYQIWERQFIDHPNRVTAEEMRSNPDQYIFCMSGSRIGDLIDIDPPKDSVYIRSHPEPYTEEMELDEKILINWLNHFGLKHDGEQTDLFSSGQDDMYRIPQVHVTGHMSFEDTAYVVNTIKPDVLVPIHTLMPEEFKKMYTGDVRIPERGTVMEL